MKKVFIGLLILAAGAGVYYLLSNKKNEDTPSVAINKELLTGSWITRQWVPAKDSMQPLFRYTFQPEGWALRSITDSIPADSIRYVWSNSGQLQLNEQKAGGASVSYAVITLNTDSLTLITPDSSRVILTRVK